MSPSPVRSPAFIALLSCIALLGAMLLVRIPVGRSSARELALHDALHFPLFVLLVALVYAALLRVRSLARGRALILAILLTTAVGGASEWAQTFTSRTASWQDFLFNLLGIAAGSATIVGAWLRSSRLFFCWLLAIAGIWGVSAFLVTRPTVLALKAEHRQADAFPQLGNFEEEWERAVWIPQGDGGDRPTRASFSSSNPTRGKQSLKIEAGGSTWAGVRVLIGNSQPWPQAGSLQFDVFNPGDAFVLGIRVDGVQGGRFSSQVPIAPGQNHCRVPPRDLVDRGRDLTQLPSFTARTIVFHLGPSPSARSFYLDNVRLE